MPRTPYQRTEPEGTLVRSRNELICAGFEARHAGIKPKSTVAKSASPKVKRSTRESSERSRDPSSRKLGRSDQSRFRDQNASKMPITPATAASSRLSVSNWRTSRSRDAPSDNRIAISRCLCVARESKRFATLAQAISRTNPTTTINRSPACTK